MVKISVIIPVYNVEDYLEETMDSIINQTMFDDIEVLMIDDGSTDDSRFLIEKYALDYDNFYAFHKENEGQGATRNYGLTLAKGDYIHFMDPDDYLPPDAYEKLYNLALSNDNDIVLGNLLRFRRYNAWDSILFKNCFSDIHEVMSSTTLEETHSILWDTSTCNKIYKKEFLEKNDLKFIEGKIFYEDILFSFKSYLCADSIAILPDIIYYWRVRRSMSSTTQQLDTVKNFRDRLKILNLCLDLAREHGLSQEILNKLYYKWLVNDFKGNLRKIEYFTKDNACELIIEVKKLLALVPDEIRDSLNSYFKILYEMVENEDIDGLIGFSNLEKELKSNPHVPDDLDEKYVKHIDFVRDGMGEDLKAEILGVDFNGDNVFLEISEEINYIESDYPHQSEAFLIDGADEYPLEVKDNTIVLPLDLIRDKNHFNIKMIYNADQFTKESILQSDRRHSIQFDDFDVDIGIGINHRAYFDIQQKTNNKIVISDVDFADEQFVFKGKSEAKISEVFILNVISFDKIFYPVNYLKGNEFTFTIPYHDVLKGVIKKWEINCSDSLNSIELEDKCKFYTKTSRIIFTNSRNKILITEDISNPVVSLYQEIDKFNEAKFKYLHAIDIIKRRNAKIERLNEKIDRLKDELNEFKSRKVVKFADRFRL